MKKIFKILYLVWFWGIPCISLSTTENDQLAWNSSSTQKAQRVFYLSYVKGGTHLLAKAITSITNKPVHLIPFDLRKHFTLNPDKYCEETHFEIFGQHFSIEFTPLLEESFFNWTKIIFLRDLRDVAISRVFWERTALERHKLTPVMTPQQIQQTIRFMQLSFADQLIAVIADPAFRHQANQSLIWMNHPGVLCCRFEDLVGPQGGGSALKQIETLQNIAHHLQIDMDETQLTAIANSLFGGTFTFRKGQINSWQEYFTPSHISLFKFFLGQQLIALGYEADDNW